MSQVWIHEWLHCACAFYRTLGYPMPTADADGAELHGYVEEQGGLPGKGRYYADLMQGLVMEGSNRVGITREAWLCGSPRDGLPETRATWKGEYFANKNLTGKPTALREDPAIDFDWGPGAPAPGVPADNFSARWTTTTFFPEGRYRFFACVDDGVRVYVDGVPVINAWVDQPATTHAGVISLAEGNHTVGVEYYENGGWAVAHIWWSRVGEVEPGTQPYQGVRFPDVSVDQANWTAIAHLASRGIISGFADGCFHPERLVTRQQFAKMVVGTMGYPVSELDVCPFTDVEIGGPATLYPDNFVAVCAAHGITKGRTATTFGPQLNISRYQVISMVVRAADDFDPGLLAPCPSGWVGSSGWGADPTHGANAARAEWNGLLAGLDTSGLDPHGAMPRGEVAQILHNLLLRMPAEPRSFSVADSAGVLSSESEAELNSLADTIRRQLGLDLMVRTVTTAGGNTAQTLADRLTAELPDPGGFVRDRALVLISVTENACAISCKGGGFPDLTSAACTRIRDSYVAPLVREGDYGGAARQAFLRLMEEALFPRTVRALVLNYDPRVPSRGNRRLHEFSPMWRDPHSLVSEYVRGLNEASGGTVTYEVVEWRDLDVFFPFRDGFRYTPEEFLRIYEDYVQAHGGEWYGYWGSPAWHSCETGSADYLAILDDNSVIAGINSGAYDEVFLLAPPLTGLYESLMVGPNAIWCNSPPLIDSSAERDFRVMTLGWEREVGCALEDFGHAAESILGHVFSSTPHPNTGVNYWELFTRYDKMFPDQAACGNVHFAPNSECDYDWGNRRYVWSTCDDWLNFPNLTGKRRLVNCTEWGDGDMAKHHLWWFAHFPKAAGLDADGFLQNWWGYLTVFLTGY